MIDRAGPARRTYPSGVPNDSSCSVRVAGEDLQLRAERGFFWPRESVLAVADLHWGKTEAFHQHGIAIPHGVFESDLERLTRLIENTGARRLLLVGDLVHSAKAMTPEVVARIGRWRARHSETDVELIRGNHERHVKVLPESWRMAVHEEHLDLGPFRFAHHPEAVADRYVWAGHLHPTVRLRSGVESLRLHCFHVGERVGVLPAFSEFTRGLTMEKGPRERVFAVVESAVVEL